MDCGQGCQWRWGVTRRSCGGQYFRWARHIHSSHRERSGVLESRNAGKSRGAQRVLRVFVNDLDQQALGLRDGKCARPVQFISPVSFPSTPHLSVEMPSPPFCSYPGAHIKEHTGSDFADSWKSAAGVQGSLGPPVTPAGNFAYA